MQKVDCLIVGGGIVGVAVARNLQSTFSNLKCLLVEKEDILAKHQTGHNSGVIHAGVYYKPDSLKAKLCIEGLKRIYEYCDANHLPYRKCGKIIVAVERDQLARLDDLYQRAKQNGVQDVRMLDSNQIREIEPNCRGIRAIHSPHTGIVDYGLLCRHFGKSFEQLGGRIALNFEAKKFLPSDDPSYPIRITSKTNSSYLSRYVITCGGLQADQLAMACGGSKNPTIVPFRGDYLKLKENTEKLKINGNIYPVPDPKFPFLGVHFTPRMDGSVWLGPNAVLSMKREGYGLLDFSPRDMVDHVLNGGLRKLAWKHLGYGFNEMRRAYSLRATVHELQKFVPALRVSDVERGPSGVRAQALSSDGNLVEDFVFEKVNTGDLKNRILHVRNAPSPAATSSLPIADMIRLLSIIMSLAQQLVEMGFQQSQIDSAINTGKAANLEQAIDWITSHEGEVASGSVESAQPTLNLSSSTAATTTEAASEANSLKCDECGKLLKDADMATAHALRTNHSSFSECTEAIKPLTAEEKEEMKKKLQERIVARRQEQKIAEEQKAIEMEKKRIVDGKALSDLKQKREEEEMKKIAEANRREKIETQLAKQRAIEQIEADKRARREKAAAEKNGGVVGDVPAPKPQPIVPPQPARQYDECNLQVRLSDGSTVRQLFKAADRFEKVMEWIRGTQQSGPFILVQNFPKKDFNENDNHKTLTELGLVPSGSLMVKALAHFQT
ncbi:unnamed protein product [Adineta ricciae]|uniref:L-2-hydroxyglutarate dehydrogenase, mitochondrial n=1 Tax=Adineta ricciae TaxID=249248 RepID=A0A815JLS2_ADIRI|nr:unnamed protein product [Adineta ricciae]